MAAKKTTQQSQPLASGSGELDSSPILGTSEVQWLKQFSYNPLRGFTPQKLVQAIESYDAGFIGEALRLWQVMARRDLMITAVKGKREDAVTQRAWKLITADHVNGDKSLEKQAQVQRERRQFFWNNLRCVDAINTAEQGKFKMFVRRVMEAQSFRHVPMHFVWRVLPQGLTATIYFVPPWLFETTTGTHRYLGANINNVYGSDVDPTNWQFVSGRGLMESGCVGYGYKHLGLSSMVRFCARHGMPFPIGKLPGSAENSAEGVAMKKAIRSLHNDGGAVIFGSGEIELLETTGTGEVFERLIDKIDRWFSVAWRGGDLSSLSSNHGTGSNQQTKETLLTEAADCDFVAEVMQSIEERLDLYFDGPGTEALVWSEIDRPNMDDMELSMKVDDFLISRGARLAVSNTLERYGREEAADDQPALGDKMVAKPATAPEPAVNAEVKPAVAKITPQQREAMRADLQPMISALETALQTLGNDGIQPIDWEAVIEATLNNGGNLEAALMRNAAEGFFAGLGLGPDEVTALLEEAINQGGQP